MAKKKVNVDIDDMDEMCAHIAKETGGDTLDKLDSVRFFIDTGNLSLNYSCSKKFIKGGVPEGRIIEGFGPEASGKSLIGSNIMKGMQCVGGWVNLLDCENASNGEFMEKVSHLNLKQVVRHTPNTLEKCFRKIHFVTKKIREYEVARKMPRKPILFVFDSLTQPPCERELRENELPEDYTPTDWKRVVGRQEQPGERAKIISAEMRKLQSMVSKQDVTVYLINQIRDKIGVLYGSPETVPGGNSVKFYASVRFRTQAKKKIEHAVLDKFSGINMQVRNVKNRTRSPFAVSDDVKLFFEEGIDPLSGLLNSLVESERVVMRTAGHYTVADEYLPPGATEYRFRASKAENRVNKQILLDCPKLIDAESAAEVQAYLDRWGGGLMASESGDYVEKPLAFDSEGNPIEGAELVPAEDYEDEQEEENVEG